MYLYAVSSLLSGATSILYDGSPSVPSLSGFLKMLSTIKLTHFGTSAHYLALLEQAGVDKANLPDFSHLEVITSTGSVLAESQYHWVYRTFGPVQLSSIAGGTDIAGACTSDTLERFLDHQLIVTLVVGGAPILPVYAGWCQARVLGMKVQIFSEEGEAIEDTGRAGELVCTAPFPSQPAFFWADPEGQKYRAAYLKQYHGMCYPHIWGVLR